MDIETPLPTMDDASLRHAVATDPSWTEKERDFLLALLEEAPSSDRSFDAVDDMLKQVGALSPVSSSRVPDEVMGHSPESDSLLLQVNRPTATLMPPVRVPSSSRCILRPGSIA
jgi:hypothetical protein